jgi:hypothetical protein
MLLYFILFIFDRNVGKIFQTMYFLSELYGKVDRRFSIVYLNQSHLKIRSWTCIDWGHNVLRAVVFHSPEVIPNFRLQPHVSRTGRIRFRNLTASFPCTTNYPLAKHGHGSEPYFALHNFCITTLSKSYHEKEP